MFTASPCIRPAHDGDYEQLCALFAELDAYHRELRPEFFRKPEGPPRERAQLQALIAGPDSTILVACDGSDVVGFATLVVRRTAAAWVRHARAYVEIDSFAVQTSMHRRGVGRLLITACFAWAAGRRFTEGELSVHAINAGACAFYESVGMRGSMLRMRWTHD